MTEIGHHPVEHEAGRKRIEEQQKDDCEPEHHPFLLSALGDVGSRWRRKLGNQHLRRGHEQGKYVEVATDDRQLDPEWKEPIGLGEVADPQKARASQVERLAKEVEQSNEDRELEAKKRRYMAFKEKIEAAIDAGKLSKEDAEKELIALRKKFFGDGD